ncbi:hypothetical protein [Parasphingopyxis sp.]|uniref:hypothetical protein n=1 Tax=Parasphingopyxis sp. TaxID=1920299 RepID=UPI0026129C6E|nr:hypothetical protein [Parasphingopyxis sp.]
MSEMVERVARAIATAQWGEDDRIATEGDFMAARAATKAMRDPTDEMVRKGGHANAEDWDGDAYSKDPQRWDEDSRRVWQSMIDTALGDEDG